MVTGHSGILHTGCVCLYIRYIIRQKLRMLQLLLLGRMLI